MSFSILNTLAGRMHRSRAVIALPPSSAIPGGLGRQRIRLRKLRRRSARSCGKCSGWKRLRWSSSTSVLSTRKEISRSWVRVNGTSVCAEAALIPIHHFCYDSYIQRVVKWKVFCIQPFYVEVVTNGEVKSPARESLTVPVPQYLHSLNSAYHLILSFLESLVMEAYSRPY